MARYEHLPLYRKSFELAVYLEQAKVRFAKRHRAEELEVRRSLALFPSPPASRSLGHPLSRGAGEGEYGSDINTKAPPLAHLWERGRGVRAG